MLSKVQSCELISLSAKLSRCHFWDNGCDGGTLSTNAIYNDVIRLAVLPLGQWV